MKEKTTKKELPIVYKNKEDDPLFYKTYIDADTGEVHKVAVIVHQLEQATNKDFEMIFYGHFLAILEDLGNKKIRILKHIIENRQKTTNIFIGTIQEISESLKISYTTVYETLVYLEEKRAIKRKIGVIYINANMVVDGRYRGKIMHQYENINTETTDEEKESVLEKEIQDRARDLEKLKQILENKRNLKKANETLQSQNKTFVDPNTDSLFNNPITPSTL